MERSKPSAVILSINKDFQKFWDYKKMFVKEIVNFVVRVNIFLWFIIETIAYTA